MINTTKAKKDKQPWNAQLNLTITTYIYIYRNEW